MAASNRTLLIASAAFAVGIAGTVVVGGLASRDRPAEVAPQAPRSAWSDPVRAPTKVVTDATSRPPLRFEPEEARDVAAAATPTPLPPQRPSSLHATAEAPPPDAVMSPVPPTQRPTVRESRREMRVVSSVARERVAERPVREPKQRVSSVESGGVMQWLMNR